MYRHNDRCLAKVDADEPIFVLRAQDRTAPNRIRSWLSEQEEHGTFPVERRTEVESIINLMENWQAMHPDRVKWPD